MNTPISDVARRAAERILYDFQVRSLESDDPIIQTDRSLARFPEMPGERIAAIIQQALDSAQPVEGKTPETDNCLSELSARLKKAEELLKKAVNYDAPMDAVHRQITAFLNQPKP